MLHLNLIENLWRDLLYAARGLRRSPAIVISALLSLGFGIGVNTSIVFVAMEFFFNHPSARDPKSLVVVRLGNSLAREPLIDSLRASGLFAEVAGENTQKLANFNDGTATIQIYDAYTTKNYFTMLGAPMLYGRGYTLTDQNEVVILSYHFWQKHFLGDRTVVGRTINLDGRACHVVGILPEEHRTLTGYGLSPDVYQPPWLDNVQFTIYARRKPDMPLQQTRVGLEVIARRMDATPSLPHNLRYIENLSVFPITGYESLARDEGMLPLQFFFGLLFIVVALILLIACANVAISMLARASARRGEIAVRLALGVSRPRLLQQFLTESLLLTTMCTVFGLLLSRLTGPVIAAIEQSLPGVPIHLQLSPDWRLLVYSTLLTAVAASVCGLFPALQFRKISITSYLGRGQKLRLQKALVIVQIATSVIVLATGFLFLHNLLRASSINPGFDVRHTLRAEINLPPTQYGKPERRINYIREVLHQIATLPGIECAAASKWTPFNGGEGYSIDITFPDNGQQREAAFNFNAVTAAYFRTMAIPIYSGRTFSETEAGVNQVIVNQSFVERYLGGRNPIGTFFRGWGGKRTDSRIVAVVGNTKTGTIGENEQPQLYGALDANKDDELTVQLQIRSTISPNLQIEAIRRVLHRIEPLAGAKVQTMNSAIAFAFLPSQLGAGVLGLFGALGLLLAAVGINAIVAYSVVQRTREIAIRFAVGATRTDIFRMVLRDAARLTLIGASIGLLAALLVTQPLAMFLVPGVKPTDPFTYAAVMLIIISTGLIAAFGPTRRANRVDPNTALRYE